jgi:peroxiredoxin
MMNMNKLSILALAGFVLAGAAYATQVAGKQDPAPAPAPAAAPKATVAELGKAAPAFALKDIAGKEVKLADYKGKIVVLEWFQPSCPVCVAQYKEDGACRVTSDKLSKDGIVWLLVNSTEANNPDSKVEDNKKFFEGVKTTRTVLFDSDGKVGMAYGAKTTPHCYVIDAKGNLAYRGAIHNAMEKDAKEKVNYVEAAVAELKAGKPVTKADTKSYGCGVKYAKAKP